jgi:hypothetical protein
MTAFCWRNQLLFHFLVHHELMFHCPFQNSRQWLNRTQIGCRSFKQQFTTLLKNNCKRPNLCPKFVNLSLFCQSQILGQTGTAFASLKINR